MCGRANPETPLHFSPAPKPAPCEQKPPKRPKAKNVKRSADTFTRTYHSEERVAFVQSLACIVPGCVKTPSENAHIAIDGMGRKAGYEKIVPLCRGHHRTARGFSLHDLGSQDFEIEHGVDLVALALDTERCWRRFAGHPTGEGRTTDG